MCTYGACRPGSFPTPGAVSESMIFGCTSYSIANRVLVLMETVSSRAYRAKLNLNTLRIVLGWCAALGACPVFVELLVFLLVSG